MPNTNIVSLDYDSIKASLIQFLKSQTEFSDYDFTGSGLNVLISLLAFNTSYFGYYLNMLGKEMFLDSAQIRDSVVSLAKQLNYTPTSSISSKAIVNLVVTPSGSPPSFLTLEKNSPFSSSLSGVTYNFLNRDSVTVPLGLDGNFTFPNVALQEGNPYILQYTVDSTNPVRYLIPSNKVDISTLKVTVQVSASNTQTDVYTPVNLIADVTPTSKVYFLQEAENGYYEVYFGNDVLGVSLDDGNVVLLDYLICNEDAPNKCNTFTSSSTIGGYSSIAITTVTAATGGAQAESLDSIRFNAPKVYESQNRAVTENDYASLILKNVQNIKSISVWGGEKNNPPNNGVVYISIQPSDGYFLTQTDKDNIINNILGPRGILNIKPTILDPNYLYIVLNALVKYNQSITNLSNADLTTLVNNVITSYAGANLNGFNSSFLYSVLVSNIDGADSSIISNLTSISVKLKFTPTLNISSSYSFNIGSANAIEPGTLSSSSFVCSGDPNILYVAGDIHYFDDDSNGFLRIYKIQNGTKVVVKSNAGTIDYTNGLISVTNFIPSSVTNGIISLIFTPIYNDVVPNNNNIVVIDPSDVQINIIAGTT